MANRNGGFIGTDGLDAPDPPTAVTPTGGNASVSVAFTAPTDTGTSAITGFVAQVSTDGTNYSAGSNTGSSSPIVVSSLTNGTAATAKVWAINAYGTSAPSDASASFTPASVLGLVAGGDNLYSGSDTIEYFSIPSTGNATDWGNLIAAGEAFTGGGNSIRGLFTGNSSNVVQFIVYATEGNATDFGDATGTNGYAGGTSSASNTTRAVFARGSADVLEYYTIGTEGNGTDFGNLSQSNIQFCGMSSSSGRGVFAGGRSGNTSFNTIEYITIANTGNVTDFGDMNQRLVRLAGCSSATRGVMGGGHIDSASNVPQTTIDYITMASTGDATDFGDLTQARNNHGAFSSSVRGVFAGGGDVSGVSGGKVNTVDYITIASTGNATDFGDLSTVRQQMGSTSNAHGGLQ